MEVAYPTKDFDAVLDNIPRLVFTGAILVPATLTQIVPVLPAGWTVLLEIGIYSPGDWFFRAHEDGTEVPGPSAQWITLPGTNLHQYLTARAAAGNILLSYLLQGK